MRINKMYSILYVYLWNTTHRSNIAKPVDKVKLIWVLNVMGLVLLAWLSIVMLAGCCYSGCC